MEKTPKTKFLTVAAYMEAQTDETIYAGLEELRTLIKKTLPHAEEVISYQMLGYKTQDGIITWIAGYTNHLGLYVVPAAMQPFGDRLTAYKTSKSAIQFPKGAPLPEDLIREIVQYAAIQKEAYRQQKKKQKTDK